MPAAAVRASVAAQAAPAMVFAPRNRLEGVAFAAIALLGGAGLLAKRLVAACIEIIQVLALALKDVACIEEVCFECGDAFGAR